MITQVVVLLYPIYIIVYYIIKLKKKSLIKIMAIYMSTNCSVKLDIILRYK